MQYRLSEFFRGGSLLLPTSVLAGAANRQPCWSVQEKNRPPIRELSMAFKTPLLKRKFVLPVI